MAFTVAAVPTGMKAGVRITPRGMRISPTRAAPSVFVTVKGKASVMRVHVRHSGACRRREAETHEDEWVRGPDCGVGGEWGRRVPNTQEHDWLNGGGPGRALERVAVGMGPGRPRPTCPGMANGHA